MIGHFVKMPSEHNSGIWDSRGNAFHHVLGQFIRVSATAEGWIVRNIIFHYYYCLPVRSACTIVQ